MKSKKYVRVLNSTYYVNEVTKNMIGGAYEVEAINYRYSTVFLINPEVPNIGESTHSWSFNFSDVLEITEEEFSEIKKEIL